MLAKTFLESRSQFSRGNVSDLPLLYNNFFLLPFERSNYKIDFFEQL